LTIADKLISIANTKSAIAQSIESSGEINGTPLNLEGIPFSQYADKVTEIGAPNTSEPPDWIRPTDWLELDIPEDTEERFTALVAVYDREENYCAFVAEGAYTIDWGDGTVEDYPRYKEILTTLFTTFYPLTNETTCDLLGQEPYFVPFIVSIAEARLDGDPIPAEDYTYDIVTGVVTFSIPLTGTVSFDVNYYYYNDNLFNDIIDNTIPIYAEDSNFISSLPFIVRDDASEIISNTLYTVTEAGIVLDESITTTNFEVYWTRTTNNAIHQYDFDNIELDGTITSEGFKQAILNITPQLGSSLTLLDFGVEYPTVGGFLSGFKDIAVSAPNLEIFRFVSDGDPNPEEYIDKSSILQQRQGTGDEFEENFIAEDNQTQYTITKPTDYSQVAVRNNSTLEYLSIYDYTVSSLGVITFREDILEEGIEYTVQSQAAGFIREFESEANQELFDLVGDPIYLETLEVRNVTTNTLLVQGVDYIATPSETRAGWGTGEITLNTPATAGHIYRIIAEVPGSAAYYRIPNYQYSNFLDQGSIKNSFNNLEQIYIGSNKVKIWSYRFAYCVGLRNISRLNLPEAVSTRYMFLRCHGLNKIKNLIFSEVDDAYYTFADCRNLEYAHFTELNVCNGERFFRESNLRYVKVDDFSKTIYAEYMFNGCKSLQFVDLGNCERLKTSFEMFYDAYSLKTVNMTNLASLTYAKWMFEECYALEYVDLSSTSALLNSSDMFEQNYNLKSVKINTSKVVNASEMFESCNKLTELDLDFSNAFELSGVIQRCSSLTTVNFVTSNRLLNYANNYQSYKLQNLSITTLYNTIYGDNGISGAFERNYSLENLPYMVPASRNTFTETSISDTTMVDISRSRDMYYSFKGCQNLKTITFTSEDLNPELENIENIFYQCESLQEIPLLDFSATIVTSAHDAFAECSSLIRSQVMGLSASHSYAYCKLSANALNEIFTNLPTVTSEDIAVYENPGVNQTGFDPTIATAKGWTVSY
jgi:hypothetical protein